MVHKSNLIHHCCYFMLHESNWLTVCGYFWMYVIHIYIWCPYYIHHSPQPILHINTISTTIGICKYAKNTQRRRSVLRFWFDFGFFFLAAFLVIISWRYFFFICVAFSSIDHKCVAYNECVAILYLAWLNLIITLRVIWGGKTPVLDHLIKHCIYLTSVSQL